MSELVDLYSEKKEKTGKVMSKDNPFPPNMFYLTAHIWIYKDGYWLIQKRALSKKVNPGIWSVTGGTVKAGENSLEGAVRELKGELNIEVPTEQLRYIGTYLQKYAFVDVYFLELRKNLKNISFDRQEVTEVEWATFSEILEKNSMHTFADCVTPGLLMIIKNQNENNNEKN